MLFLLSRADDLAGSSLAAAWTGAVATAVGVLVAATAIVLTVVQLVQAARNVKEAALTDAANSSARTRPYVSVRIVPGIGGGSSFDMLIENHGRTVARAVRISPASGKYDADALTPTLAAALNRMFERGFDLSPGERRRFFWRLDGVDTSLPLEEQPSSVRDELHVTYEWQRDSNGAAPIRYSEYIWVDLTDYAVIIPSPQTGATTTSPQELERELANTRLAIKALSEHVAELRR